MSQIDDRPVWACGPIIWREDECTKLARDPDHENGAAAWRRLFGEPALLTREALATYDGGDMIGYLFPGGRVWWSTYLGTWIGTAGAACPHSHLGDLAVNALSLKGVIAGDSPIGDKAARAADIIGDKPTQVSPPSAVCNSIEQMQAAEVWIVNTRETLATVKRRANLLIRWLASGIDNDSIMADACKEDPDLGIMICSQPWELEGGLGWPSPGDFAESLSRNGLISVIRDRWNV